jgi:hypothetical protein
MALQKEIQTDGYRDDINALKTENSIFKYVDGEDGSRFGRRGRGYGYGEKTEAIVYNYNDPRGRSRRSDSSDSENRHNSPHRTPRSHRSGH